MREINLWTDGSCKGYHKSGFGGWAFVLEDHVNDDLVEASTITNCGGVLETTSNRMELTAALEALVFAIKYADEPLNDVQLNVFSDSSYVVNAVDKGWLTSWATNGKWTTYNRKGAVANQDLWQPLYWLLKILPNVTFTHVKAHSGIEHNETADRLAGEQALNMQTEFETVEQAEKRRTMNQKNRNKSQMPASYKKPRRLLLPNAKGRQKKVGI